jgi:uncharacterized membrane protein
MKKHLDRDPLPPLSILHEYLSNIPCTPLIFIHMDEEEIEDHPYS